MKHWFPSAHDLPVSQYPASLACALYADRRQAGILNRVTRRNQDTFSYNARSEVTSATIQPSHTNRYEYDNIGNNRWTALNAATTSYTANQLNQYTSIGNGATIEPEYDLDGNLIWDGRFHYTYDAENRLIAVYNGSSLVVSNAYDHQSRRVLKVTPVATHTFLYDGWNLVQETIATASSVTTNHYIWGKDLSGTLQGLPAATGTAQAGAGGVGGLLAVSVNNSYNFPLYDNNGNITAYVDEFGIVVAEYRYDAFGNTISQSGPMADSFPHRFSTKYYDHETSLYYYGYRFYSPVLMRWLNRDMIKENGGKNLYGFVGNNGLNATDYVGLLKIWYDSNGKEVCRTQRWWPFHTTKYIQGPSGNINFNGKNYWQVWSYDNAYLPGACSGVSENWDDPMRTFVNSQKNLPFTSPTWYQPIMPDWIQSYDLVMANSPTDAAWDYKRVLSDAQWYIYKGKAYRFDSIGNITWGAVMKSYSWPKNVALIGAGLYQIKTDFENNTLTPWSLIYRLLRGTSGDEPRDQEAIHEGYNFE